MGTSWTPARRAVAAARGSPARHDLAVAEIEAASNLQVRRRTSILPRYTCPALTAAVTVPARCARLAVPDAIAEQLAHQQGGVIPARVPGDRALRLRTRGRPVPSRPVRPLSRSPGSRPAISTPAFPGRPVPGNHRGRQAGCTGMHARLSGSRQAGARDRRGPSVAVRGRPWKADGAHRPSRGTGSRPLTCIAAVTASGSAMTVSATALRVQEFDKGRGPVGLPPIGQACDLPAWPDQGPREGSLVKFWSGHQPDADAHRERGHSARRAWLVTPLTRPPESGPWTAGSKGANRGGDRRIRGADTGLSCRGPG